MDQTRQWRRQTSWIRFNPSVLYVSSCRSEASPCVQQFWSNTCVVQVCCQSLLALPDCCSSIWQLLFCSLAWLEVGGATVNLQTAAALELHLCQGSSLCSSSVCLNSSHKSGCLSIPPSFWTIIEHRLDTHQPEATANVDVPREGSDFFASCRLIEVLHCKEVKSISEYSHTGLLTPRGWNMRAERGTAHRNAAEHFNTFRAAAWWEFPWTHRRGSSAQRLFSTHRQ